MVFGMYRWRAKRTRNAHMRIIPMLTANTTHHVQACVFSPLNAFTAITAEMTLGKW